jgi:tRNA threonylcarbamoyladenosine biosynthesis protein TsaE
MTDLNFTTHSGQETFDLGKAIAVGAAPGDIFCLFGDLGTGKTTFVKGLASGLGVKPDDVHSPTFTLMNVYQGRPARRTGRTGGRGLEIFHFDLYRIEQAEEILALDYDEYLYGKGVAVIEWADRLGTLAPRDYYAVDFAHRAHRAHRPQVTEGNPCGRVPVGRGGEERDSNDARDIRVRAGGSKTIDDLVKKIWPCGKCKGRNDARTQ